MIIDKKGKLFGKINILDLAIILLIVVAVGLITIKFVNSGFSNTQSAKCTYVAKVSGIKEASADYIEKGDVLYDGEGVLMGTVIEEPKVVPAEKEDVKTNGEYVLSEVPGRVDVYVTIEGNGIENENGFYLDGKVSVLLGTSRFFSAEDIEFTGDIVEIKH